jgi:glycosyltransferase involved in cell wall biosynthesis
MPFRPAIIAPTLNNAATLPDVIARTVALGHHLFIVNDGSTDGTAAWLETFANEQPNGVTVLHHDRNRGKAIALRTGFDAAIAAGFTHAATIDTDGQLRPEEIPDLLEVAASNPNALVVGHRDETRADYPSRSRLGRRLSNLAIRLETGCHVDDCQCGLRVYPLRLFEVVRCRMGRFAFEAEIITRAAWAGCEILSVPVSCRYFPSDERVSHFRPWRDSVHGVLLHLMLLARSVAPLPHRQIRHTT